MNRLLDLDLFLLLDIKSSLDLIRLDVYTFFGFSF